MLVFANPAFLWALAATAIPLMLHLFQRRKTVVTPFPTLRFLKAAQKRSSSRIRFENFLLWLLRTLLVMMLAFAFALPVLRAANSGSLLSRTQRDVALVLDASHSMDYEMDRGRVWDISKDAAVSVIQGLLPGDRVCVYLAADTPMPVIEKPTSEHATVIQAIRALPNLPGSSCLNEAVALALRALEQESGRRDRELFIFTDGQALAWQGFRDASLRDSADPGPDEAATSGDISREQREKIPCFALLAGPLQPDNVAPASVTVSPALLLAGQTARLGARVQRSGPSKPVTVTVEVSGEERARRSINADTDAESTLEFSIAGLEPGVHVTRVITPRDALVADDEFFTLLRVRRQLPALVVGPPDATRYLRAALAPGADEETLRQADAAELDSLDLRDFQAVILCDAFPLSGQAVMRVEEYAANGGVVIIFPGDRADPAAYADMRILPAMPASALDLPADLAIRPLRRIPHSQDQVVTFQLALPPGSVPVVAARRILTFGDLQEGGAVLITAGEDQPFLLGRAIGRGRVFMFAVSGNRDWSTLPLTAFFLPAIHQLIRQGAGAAIQPPHLTMGAVNLPVNEAIPHHREGDTILTPSGAVLAIKDIGNRTLAIESLNEAGIYTRVRGGNGAPEPVMAVNADRAESHLIPATPDDVASWSGFRRMRVARDPEELARLIEEFRSGRSLAEIFLWLALLLALAEWWFANRALRHQPGATEKMTVDLAGKVTTA